MCSSIIMENYQGDLTDIVRGGAYGVAINSSSQLLPSSSSSSSSTSTISSTISHGHEHHHHHLHSNDLSWHHQQQHLSSSDPIMNFSSSVLEASTSFGDPFSTIIRDPFLQLPNSASSPYFSSPSGGLEEAATAGFGATSGNINASSTSGSGTSCVFGGHSNNNNNITVEEHNNNDMRRPCKNIFSNMIQISPNAKVAYDSQPIAPSPRPIKPSSLLSPSKDSLLHTSALQISSPRNPPLKRRKNQAKKVVCIPAPAAANSRQTGEVVPSDLWAWRKYGQKPIKGSPYPRGYYRCSSSKGCSARKQVERSRTDPNMLVITYTSEHNHPWPTQRNALAGSTRSQPSKGGNNNNNTGSNSKNSSESNQKGTAKAKEEEQQEMSNNTSEGNDVSPVANNSVKEENMFEIEMDEGEFSDGMPYKPSCLMDQSNDNQSAEDFFAELGEIEADPLNLLFTQGFGAASASASDDHQRESKALDPFHLFDWSGNTTTNNINNNNSFDEPNKRRL